MDLQKLNKKWARILIGDFFFAEDNGSYVGIPSRSIELTGIFNMKDTDGGWIYYFSSKDIPAKSIIITKNSQKDRLIMTNDGHYALQYESLSEENRNKLRGYKPFDDLEARINGK